MQVYCARCTHGLCSLGSHILGSRTLCTHMSPFGGIKLKVGVTTAYPC